MLAALRDADQKEPRCRPTGCSGQPPHTQDRCPQLLRLCRECGKRPHLQGQCPMAAAKNRMNRHFDWLEGASRDRLMMRTDRLIFQACLLTLLHQRKIVLTRLRTQRNIKMGDPVGRKPGSKSEVTQTKSNQDRVK